MPGVVGFPAHITSTRGRTKAGNAAAFDTGSAQQFIFEHLALAIPGDEPDAQQIPAIKADVGVFHEAHLPAHDDHPNEHDDRDGKLKDHQTLTEPPPATRFTRKDVASESPGGRYPGQQPGRIDPREQTYQQDDSARQQKKKNPGQESLFKTMIQILTYESKSKLIKDRRKCRG